jgi:YD repeat-containing protein
MGRLLIELETRLLPALKTSNSKLILPSSSFTDQAGLVSSYTYDLDGHRLTSTYPTGVEVQRAYDSSSRLTTLKNGSGTTMATFNYDILDRVTGTTLANSGLTPWSGHFRSIVPLVG